MIKFILMQIVAVAAIIPVFALFCGNFFMLPIVVAEYYAVRSKYGQKFLRDFYKSHCKLESTIYPH